MTFSPIESVITAAEQQAVIDWELEHRPPQPCPHDTIRTDQFMCGDKITRCANCGRPMEDA